MMFGPDGEILRDIDIDELIISAGRPVGSRIVLTKNEVTYQKTISGGIYPDFFEQKKIKITREEFDELSDAIHNAGLLNIVSPNVEILKEEEIALGYISTEYMICYFDDGVKAVCIADEHKWNTKFHEISRILRSLFEEEPEIVEEPKEYCETACCGVAIPENWSYCPECGKKLEDNDKKETQKTFDEFATVFICDKCMNIVHFEHNYCGNCGNKMNLK